MVGDTPSHGSDHLCLIWKESIHNCRWYRADTACGTDGRTDGRTDGQTDRRTDGRSETSIPPQQLRCAGGIISTGHHGTRDTNVLLWGTPDETRLRVEFRFLTLRPSLIRPKPDLDFKIQILIQWGCKQTGRQIPIRFIENKCKIWI